MLTFLLAREFPDDIRFATGKSQPVTDLLRTCCLCCGIVTDLLAAQRESLRQVNDLLLGSNGETSVMGFAFSRLHWLTIRWRIQYKIRLLMHSIHSDRSHVYLADIRSASTIYAISRELSFFTRFTSSYTKFSERAFSFSGPSAWTALPADIRDEIVNATFIKKLRTFYFISV